MALVAPQVFVMALVQTREVNQRVFVLEIVSVFGFEVLRFVVEGTGLEDFFEDGTDNFLEVGLRREAEMNLCSLDAARILGGYRANRVGLAQTACGIDNRLEIVGAFDRLIDSSLYWPQ